MTRQHLTESDYRAAVERGQIAPCDTGLQLTSAEYAKGWEDCRAQVMRFVEELLDEPRHAIVVRAAARRSGAALACDETCADWRGPIQPPVRRRRRV